MAPVGPAHKLIACHLFYTLKRRTDKEGSDLKGASTCVALALEQQKARVEPLRDNGSQNS